MNLRTRLSVTWLEERANPSGVNDPPPYDGGSAPPPVQQAPPPAPPGDPGSIPVSPPYGG